MALVSRLGRAKIHILNNPSKFGLGAIQPLRNFKSALKIKWVKPDRIPSIHPEQSGDLAPLGTLDLKQFPTDHKPSEELLSADEIVQRIHTLEFFPAQKQKEEFLIQYTNRVKAHQLDDDSPEVKLAKLTVNIRYLRLHLERHPRDTFNKVRLKELIDKRNQCLTRLRSSDYKKFEWILDKLDLLYKVFRYGTHEKVERKKSMLRLTALFIEKVKSERLATYKSYLESQKEAFLNEKLEKLMWIKKTEEECGVTPTVNEETIEAVRKQLQDLHISKPQQIV